MSGKLISVIASLKHECRDPSLLWSCGGAAIWHLCIISVIFHLNRHAI